MLDAAILSQVALGYSPFIDRERAVSATRLTIVPLRPDAQLDAAQLLATIGEIWPESGGRVSLNIVSESLLQGVLGSEPATNLMIELPAFMAGDPAHHDAIRALHARGTKLLVKGRPLQPLPRDLLPCFAYSVIDLSEQSTDAAAPANTPEAKARNMPLVQSGVRRITEMEASFARGAQGVFGWPLDDDLRQPLPGRKPAQPMDMQAIIELIGRTDKEESIDRLEATLKRDPALAFKLLRYINSPAFGLSVEIASFRHAIMMLGYKRLKRWLALLLATASKDANLKPVMFAAVRRGLLMEELVRGSGDEEMRNEVFICGVFSLLDRMFQQPFAQLLDTIPVPEKVRQALVDEAGPYQPLLGIVRAIESESLFDLREAAETAMLSVAEINRALLRGLLAASSLE